MEQKRIELEELQENDLIDVENIEDDEQETLEPEKEPEKELGKDFEKKPEKELYPTQSFKPIDKQFLDDKSKHLLKELPFFKIEPFILIFAGLLLPITLVVLDIFGFFPGASIAALMLVIFSMWGIYFVKYFLFMPTGKKVIIERFFKNTGVSLSCEKIPGKGEIEMGDDIPPVQVTQANKHFEMSSGRPLIIAIEEVPQNCSLLQLYQPDRSSRELNSIIKVTWNTAWHAATENLLGFGNRLRDPVFLMSAGVLVGIILIGIMMWMNLDTLSQLQGTMESLKTAVEALKASMPVAAQAVA